MLLINIVFVNCSKRLENCKPTLKSTQCSVSTFFCCSSGLVAIAGIKYIEYLITSSAYQVSKHPNGHEKLLSPKALVVYLQN